DAACMEVHAVLHARGKRPSMVCRKIFRITDNRAAKMGSVDTKLVHAAGVRLKLQPGERLSCLLRDAIVGDSVISTKLAVLGYTHLVAIRRRFANEPSRDAAFAFARHAFYERPVGLLRLALAKCLGQLDSRTARTGNHQHAGGVAIKPVHQARLLALLVTPGFQHTIHVTVDP